MLAGLGVLIWTTVDAMGCKTTDPYGYGICDEKNGFDTVKLAVSISLFGVGMISMFTGLFLPRHTMDLPTLRLKVDEHNKQLKAKLGLASNEQSNDEEVATIWFSPFGAPNGGGLMIGGRL
jgi:hypothetical protein